MQKTSWYYQDPVLWLLLFVLIVIVIRGLATGTATFVYTSYKKSEDPVYYWCGIAIPSIFIAMGIYALLFE